MKRTLKAVNRQMQYQYRKQCKQMTQERISNFIEYICGCVTFILLTWIQRKTRGM